MKNFTLLFFMLASASVAAQSIENIVPQNPLTLPHHPGVDLSSLQMWPAKIARNRRIKKDAKGTVYDTTNRHDRYGFRLTAPVRDVARRKHHLFITGCSISYGLGVEDGETFAAHLEEQFPDHRVVNMSAVGGGPAELLYLWKNFSLEQVYPEATGILLFNILANHSHRLKRTWQYLGWAFPFSPVFDEDFEATSPISHRWDFSWAKNMRKWKLEYYWLRLVSHFDHIAPQEFNDLMVPYLVRAKAAYLARFPRGRFVVTWFLSDIPTLDAQSVPGFLAALDDAGIEYWVPPVPKDFKRSEYMIPRDNHPNARAHREQADFLKGKISLPSRSHSQDK